jgi:hypothetical protein
MSITTSIDSGGGGYLPGFEVFRRVGASRQNEVHLNNGTAFASDGPSRINGNFRFGDDSSGTVRMLFRVEHQPYLSPVLCPTSIM